MSVAVLINGNALGGTEKAARWVKQYLPDARLALTQSAAEARQWLDEEIRPRPPQLLLGGGGDGTIIGLLDELRRLKVPFPTLGVLPLGTGNAWAHVLEAPPLREAVQRVARIEDGVLPSRTYSLVEIQGRLAHFAGTGWDAEVVSDYQAQLRTPPMGIRGPPGLGGYLAALLSRTVPRHLLFKQPLQVRLENLGVPAQTFDDAGTLVDVGSGASGEVLYEGRAGVAGVATTTEYGFGVKAFPHAHRVPGRLSARVYAAGVVEALLHVPWLLRGKEVPHMHDFFLTRGKMSFDRAVPLQIGGDLAGMCREFEFALATETVRLLDWSKLSA